MYKTILVTLDGTRDGPGHPRTHQETRETHAQPWLCCFTSRDGWAARTYGADAVSPEITQDTDYLKKVRAEFQAAGIPTDAELAYGEPSKEIVKWVEKKGCDLVAMSTHGHRFLADLFLGSTSRHVRHTVKVPVLLLRPNETAGDGALCGIRAGAAELGGSRRVGGR